MTSQPTSMIRCGSALSDGNRPKADGRECILEQAKQYATCSGQLVTCWFRGVNALPPYIFERLDRERRERFMSQWRSSPSAGAPTSRELRLEGGMVRDASDLAGLP